jgi:hypothetical protein
MAQSETLSVSGNWTRNAVLVSGGAIASPDGLASGTLIVATSGSAEHKISRSTATTVASGAVVTTSCFFKAHGTNNFAQLVIGGFTFSPLVPYANFSLSGNGAITTGIYSSAFIENYGNGWYRCGFSVTAAASGTPTSFIIPIIASGTTRDGTFAGNGNGVYAWGAQVETGSIATSYIPTTAAAVTRNADVITLSGAVSGCIGQTEGTIYVEVDYRNTALTNARIPLYIMNAGSPNVNSLRIEISGAGAWFASLSANNATIWTLSTAASQPAGIYKIAVSYKNTDSVIYINGNQVATSNAAFTFSAELNKASFEGTTAGNNTFNDRIRSAALYTTRLTNAELAALTTL